MHVNEVSDVLRDLCALCGKKEYAVLKHLYLNSDQRFNTTACVHAWRPFESVSRART
jgi:hypothetical protein